MTEFTNEEIIDRLTRLEDIAIRSFQSIDQRLTSLERTEQQEQSGVPEDMRRAFETFREDFENNTRYLYDKFERQLQTIESSVERTESLVNDIAKRVD
ncbi:MAG: hypothetical protein HGA67_01090 [Candidatus Yonathbacteria bacterium]|nr:hypothetical protein [Candidatus Yonathbacteria bacterium]